MKSFNKIFVIMFAVITVVFIGVNLYMEGFSHEKGRVYRVEAERIAQQISQSGLESVNLLEYQSITNVERLERTSEKEFFQGDNSDYLIKEINGDYYRFDYLNSMDHYQRNAVFTVNTAMLIMSVVITGVMIFIRIRLLKPFNKLKDVPYELSKGNLNIPLKENKNRFFGRFVWGMDLLRENLEEQRVRELELQKEKKTLILSISHDIKTPLSAIKLYAKALSRNLYSSPEKQQVIAESINQKADEIENFVSQIVKASSEDFLNLEVNKGEFYLSVLIDKINAYYSEKLDLLKIEFGIGEYSNCLLKGDLDRAVEVLQNIIENAVKYGDGHSIAVSITEEEDCSLVTVSNSGCTLPENEMPHIFDSFWRGSNTGNNSGSGLGLYICRQLMKKMDGDIFANYNNQIMNVSAVFRRA